MARIRLAFITSPSPSAHSVGGWRHPRSYQDANWDQPAYWQHVAKTLERGCFDMLFFGDSLQLHDDRGGSPDTTIKYAIQFPRLDPMPFIPLMAEATRHIGFGVTASTGFHEPYHFARLIATLDLITGGRVGWNIVAGYGQAEARRIGLSEARGHDERYARAEEFTTLCCRLWGSIKPEAIVADRKTGIFADPARIEKFVHHGTFFHSEGPLSVPPSPQGRPVLIQAGASAEGLAFAARHAEVHFAVRGSIDGMRAHVKSFDAALNAAGRKRADAKVLWSAAVFVGETEAEARRREAEVLDNVPLEAGLTLLGGHLGADLANVPLDEPVRNLDPEKIKGAKGLFAMLAADFGADFTLRDAARIDGAGLSGLRIVGSPKQVADRMEELIDQGGGDGFMFRPHTLPGSFEDFVDLVVPELQRRGRVRRSYGARTMRDTLFSEDGC
jgi:FMN-dependent oxidoreductase (nitrilotriacetate monooxygenase family)